MSRPKMMKISSDRLVPKLFRGAPSTRAQRFYNWSDDGNHPPLEGQEVACDEWHIEMCVAGICRCDGPEEAVRIVDRMRRDRQLAREAKCGWNKLSPKALKKMRNPEPAKKPNPKKDDK